MRSRVILAVLGMLFVALVLVACGGGTTKPPHFGVFIKTGKQLTETTQFKGTPSADADLPKATDSQPIVVAWLQNLVLDYIVIRDDLGAGNEVAFTAKPVGDGIVELQVKNALKDGAYCLVKGDPMASPADVPYYCFQVGSQTSVGMVPTTRGGQPPARVGTPTPPKGAQPTPNPGAQQTAVAAAATQLVNPGNAATQAAAVKVIKDAAATADAADVARWESAKNALASALQASKACTSRVRSKIDAGDYSEIRAGADLRGCDLSKLNLFGIDFSGVNLSYTNLEGANLKGAKFNAESNLERADLRGANLEGVDLSKATTRLAIFSMPLPTGVPIESVVRNVASTNRNFNLLDLVWIPARAQILWGGYLFDPESGKMIQQLTTRSYFVPPLPTFSADGKIVALVSDYQGRVNSLDDGKEIGQFEQWETVAWAPNGNTALITGREGVRLWNPTTGKTLASISGANLGALSPDGKQIAVSQQEGIVLWDAQTGTKVKTLIAGVQAAYLSFSPDGRWLAVYLNIGSMKGAASQLRVVNIDTGKIVLQQLKSENYITNVSWTPTNTRLIVVETGPYGQDASSRLSIWNIASIPELVRELKLVHYEAITKIVLDPRGNWVALTNDQMQEGVSFEILLVNVSDGTEIGADFFPWFISQMDVSPDGKSLAVTWHDSAFVGTNTNQDATSLQLLPVQAFLAQ